VSADRRINRLKPTQPIGGGWYCSPVDPNLASGCMEKALSREIN